MADPSPMTPEQFLREVGEIVKMPIDKPETIASALRDIRADFDQFAEWAQPYLDSGSWGGHSILDAIKQETIKRDAKLAGVEKEIGDVRMTLGITYGQDAEQAVAALCNELVRLGASPTRIARDAIRKQRDVLGWMDSEGPVTRAPGKSTNG
jgi:hypothetical protein